MLHRRASRTRDTTRSRGAADTSGDAADRSRDRWARALHLGSAPLVAGALCAADGLGPLRGAISAGTALAGGILTEVLLGPEPLTRADHVTRVRASLITALAGRLLAGRLLADAGLESGADGSTARLRTIPQAALFTLAIGLDAIDGQVARRTGCTTTRGWRFDLEADAAAIAVLSAAMLHRTRWVVVPGALRYVFGAARQLVPTLRGELEPRLSRRVIAGGSMVALVATTWPMVPQRAVRALTGGAALALSASFARDCADLLRGFGADGAPGQGRPR